MKYEYKGKEIYPIVGISHNAIAYFGGITMREFYQDKIKCARAWRIAVEKIQEHFGDLLSLKSITGPHISYGHIICLGAPVIFPENTEPNVKPIIASIDEGIEFLLAKRNIDYSQQPIFKHYYEICSYLKEQFPERNVQFSGMGYEGPITSAILMRGPDFIYDIIDEPEKAKQFLAMLTDSIVNFRLFINNVNGIPEINPNGAGLCDDFASLISPDMWPEFVVPYWNQCYEKITTGKRSLHCENLAPGHLKYLKEVKLSHFQPSVSKMLTIENIKANTDVPFDWLLYSFEITEMSDFEISEWVDKTVQAGIVKIRTQFGRYALENDKMDRILAFYKAFEKYKI